MAVTGVTLQVLPGYQLRLFFPNGSEAVINLKQRFRAIRVGRVASFGLFQTAHLVDDEVVWDDGTCCVRASISELLDSMQMGR